MKTLTKKSKLWITLSCIAFVLVAGLTTLLIVLLNKVPNYDGLYIPLNQVNNLGYASTDDSCFLIALTDDTEEKFQPSSFTSINKEEKRDYEKVKFKNKNGNKEVEQTLNLESFNQTDRFVFLVFSETNKTGALDEYNYVVDKQSGEIYSLDILSGNIQPAGKSIRSCDWGDSIIIYTSEYSPENHLGDTNVFYILSIENDQLKLEELFNSDAFKNNWTHSNIIMADKHHNCIIEKQQSGTSTFYIMDKSRKISQLNINQSHLRPISGDYTYDDDYFYKTPLGEIYCSSINATYVLNENGIFVETEPISFIDYKTENLFYVDESTNSEYYYEGTHTVKITYLDDNNYTIEAIYYGATPSSDDKIVNLFLFSFTKDTVTKISAIDGTFQVYNINYKDEPIYIYKIEVFDITRIKFYAQDAYLNQISGVIDSNGVIEYSFEEKEYKIMYIPPIRKKK